MMTSELITPDGKTMESEAAHGEFERLEWVWSLVYEAYEHRVAL
jgi:hypothetical protein